MNLFRKYLNYTEKSRQLVPLQDLKISMMEDIPELVSQGYLIIFELWSMLGKIVCIAYFMLRKHPHSAIPLFAYPILIFIYVQCTPHGCRALLGLVPALTKCCGTLKVHPTPVPDG